MKIRPAILELLMRTDGQRDRFLYSFRTDADSPNNKDKHLHPGTDCETGGSKVAKNCSACNTIPQPDI
jgi:cytochrome c2